MKYRIALLLLLWSITLSSQDILSDINNGTIKENVLFTEYNNKKQFIVVQNDSVRIYNIYENAQLELDHTIFNYGYQQANDQYLIGKSNNTIIYHDLSSQNTFNLNEIFGNTTLRSFKYFNPNNVVISTNKNNNLKTYNVDFENFSIIDETPAGHTIHTIYKNYYLLRSKNTNYCIINNETQSQTCVDSISPGFAFTNNHFVYSQDNKSFYLNLNTNNLARIPVNEDRANLIAHKDHQLLIKARTGSDYKLYKFNLNTSEITILDEGQRLKYGRIKIIDEFRYFHISGGKTYIRDLNSGQILRIINSGVHSIIDSRYLVSSGAQTVITDIESSKKLKIDKRIGTSFMEPQKNFKISNSLYILRIFWNYPSGLNIYTFNTNEFEILRFDSKYFNPHGLDFLTDIQQGDNFLYLEDEHLYTIDNSSINKISQGVYYPNPKNWSNAHKSKGNHYPHNEWCELYNDSLHFFQFKNGSKHLLNQVPLYKLDLKPPYDYIHVIQSDEDSYYCLSKDHKSEIYRTNGYSTKKLTQTKHELLYLMGFAHDKLYYHDSRKLKTTSNSIGYEVYANESNPSSYFIDTGDEFLFIGNHIYRITEDEPVPLMRIDPHSVVHFKHEDYLIIADNTKIVKYNTSNKELTTILTDYATIHFSYPYLFLSEKSSRDITHVFNVKTESLTKLNITFDVLVNSYIYNEDVYLLVHNYTSSTGTSLLKSDNNFTKMEELHCSQAERAFGAISIKDDWGLVIAGEDILVFDSDNNFSKIPHLKGIRNKNNIHQKDGSLYFIAIDPTKGRQVFKLNNLDNIISNPIDNDKISNISIFPNPTCDIINIDNEICDAKYNIYDLSGNRLASDKIRYGQINVSHFIPGTYIIQIYRDNEIWMGKFIKLP